MVSRVLPSPTRVTEAGLMSTITDFIRFVPTISISSGTVLVVRTGTVTWISLVEARILSL